MTTRLTLTIAGSESGIGKTIDVSESYDEVLNKVVPISPPSSAEGHQINFTYNKADGSGRVLVHPNLIGTAEENPEE